MFIHEAVKEAMNRGKLIHRKSSPFWMMNPTNAPCSIMTHSESKELPRCSVPEADDLMADDWEVV